VQPSTPPPPPPTQPTTNDDEERRRAEEAERARAAAREAATKAIAEMVHFDYDKFDIRDDDRPVLDRKAAVLLANPEVRLRISGHADERGSDEYNLALGNRRADAVRRYLVSKGVAADRLDIISYGEERPLVQGADEESWFQNRRAEFEITAGGDNLVMPQ
ncbi:MAG TPA: peptidoglycan-associated lipoprotein Pal, partial [Gemmatimonadales bacterium]|nr:peptidoglycan-associated lipoprotein Pal [Gemmatimonadales bacterium]